MSDHITLPENVTSSIKTAMETGGGVSLPFAAPYLWVINGRANNKALGGAQYFGGWATNQEDFDPILQSEKRQPISYLKQEEVFTDKDSYQGYTCRGVIVAPMGMRICGVTKDKQRLPAYSKGSTPWVQMLVYLADRQVDDQKVQHYIPWGPVVLSAKGYQAGNLRDSFAAWEKATQKVRQEVAPQIPSYFFYAAVGTFGKEREAKVVGTGDNTSPITPVKAYIPDEIMPDLMRRIFVGPEVAAQMAALIQSAQEWINAWKIPGETGMIPPHQAADYVPEQPEENIPF